jgi:hypothetical protein
VGQGPAAPKMGKGGGCNICCECGGKFEAYDAEEYADDSDEVDYDTCPDCLYKAEADARQASELKSLRAENARLKARAAAPVAAAAAAPAAAVAAAVDSEELRKLQRDNAALRAENERLTALSTPSPVRVQPAAAAAAAQSLSPSSCWALKPVTRAAGSAPYLLTEPTVIGRVESSRSQSQSQSQSQGQGQGQGQSQSQSQNDEERLKISINATGSAGISRTHAALGFSTDGQLTLVSKSINLIKVARAGSAAAPMDCRQGDASITLGHDDLLQLDGFREEPRFIFQVQQLGLGPAVASPPDDAPEPAADVSQLRRELNEARGRIAQLEQANAKLTKEKEEGALANAKPPPNPLAAAATVDLTADSDEEQAPAAAAAAAPRKRKAAAVAAGAGAAKKVAAPPGVQFAIRRTCEKYVEEFDEENDFVDCYGQEVDAAMQIIREEVEVHEDGVMETDRTGMLTAVFATVEEANDEARERFVSYCEDWGKELLVEEEEDEEEVSLDG